jgi:uncharacterized protein YjeT (DUF2065 family)
MGERGACGACPSLAGFMNNLGIALGCCVLVLEGLLILRGAANRAYRVFPLFYSYIAYCFCWVVGMYIIRSLDPEVYPSAYWICYLVSILMEFMVLIELSDHIFQPFPAIRSLGRALTCLVSVILGLLYVLPALHESAKRSSVLLDFTLRASMTKAVILTVLFYVARHYGSRLGRNVGGLMFGFSIYVAMNIAIMACAKVFGPVLFRSVFWFMVPLAFTLCALVWTISLWEVAPIPRMSAIPTATERDSEAVALELTRLNNELSKLLHK